MIRLGNEDVPEEVVIRAGSRYAILKVTNGTMTIIMPHLLNYIVAIYLIIIGLIGLFNL
jgi:hypothetical protein